MDFKTLEEAESFISDIYDPIRFQEAFFQVERPEVGLMPYRAYEYQKKFTYDDSELIVVNKSRQTGISTQVMFNKLHKAITTPKYSCIVISARQDQADELINIAREALFDMREPFVIPLVNDNKSEIVLENRSRLIARSAHQSAGRGYHGDLVLDEFAHIQNDKQIFEAAMQLTVRRGYDVTMISTPYGDRGVFAEIVKGVLSEEIKDWSLHTINWRECPDLEYERIRPRAYSDEIFQQEYECQFLDETTAMISWEMLLQATDHNLDLYSLSDCPQTAYKRYVGIDPGEKVNETGFILVEKVGRQWFVRYILAQKMSKDVIIELCKHWKRTAKPTKFYVDATGMGAPIEMDLKKELGEGFVEGITLSTQSKERLVYNMVGLFETGKISIPDNDKLKVQLHALERMQTEIKGLTKFSGKVKGQQDDLIWALALALADNLLTMPTLEVAVKPMKWKPKRRGGYGRY